MKRMAVPVQNTDQSVSPARETKRYPDIEQALQALDAGHEVDPMELGRLARESQGSLESEYCFGDESNLHQYFNNCKKNPGHKGFIPIDELSLEHLPESYRSMEYYNLIHCQAALTVKLTTYYMSAKRPEKWKMRGRKFTQKATGFIFWASAVKAEEGESCPCQKCASSDTPLDSWYIFKILTAQHVVFDQSEADVIQITFSYYNDSDKAIITKTEKVKCEQSNSGDDVCKLTCIIHDEDLYSKLHKYLDQMYNFHPVGPSENFSQWQAIVSHPHGLEKHVTFGKFNENIQRGSFSISLTPRLTPVTYDTDTCPGSSGARIFIWSSDERIMILTHSGCQDETNNKSSSAVMWLREESGHEINLYQGMLADYSNNEIRSAFVGVYEILPPNGIQLFHSPDYKPIGLDNSCNM